MINPVDIFSTIVLQMTSLSRAVEFKHGEKYFLNGVFDDVDFSDGRCMVALFTPIVSIGLEQPSYPIMMMFGIKQDLLEYSDNTRPLLNDAFDISQQFLLRLKDYVDVNDYRVTESINNVKRTEFENQYDVNLCGVLVMFDWKPLGYNSECIL